MKKSISLVLVFVLALSIEVAEADFTFGTPTNLGPTVNTSVEDGGPSISMDGLSLYFYSFLSGWGQPTLRVATRETVEDLWSEAVSLEPPLNGSLGSPCISADGLSLYFDAELPGGSGGNDICLATRETISAPWGNPVNLGPAVNSSDFDMGASISSDGLELYFGSYRPSGSGDWDVWVTTRANISDPWGTAVNLGPTVNSSGFDGHPGISPDGLVLFFSSNRAGGYGDWDIWITRRATINNDWDTPVNLGPSLNTACGECEPSFSADGRMLYFSDWMIGRPGGLGTIDLWQVPIVPSVDLNDDGIIDAADMCIVVDNWGTDNQLCDVGPMPWGDGIVDVQDLVVLAEHLFEEFPPVE